MQHENIAQYLSGILFEKYITRFSEIMGLGSQIDHNNFDPAIYPNDNHNVVDIVIRDKALIECTNPKQTTFMNDSIMLNKLDYFERADPKHLLSWFLVVSFAMFSDYIKQLVDRLGITLIILNYHANKTNRTTFIRHLFHSKLYSVFKRYKPKKSGFVSASTQLSVTTLPQYAVMSSSKAVAILNYLHQHRDTVKDEAKEDEQKPKTWFEIRYGYDGTKH